MIKYLSQKNGNKPEQKELNFTAEMSILYNELISFLEFTGVLQTAKNISPEKD